MIVLFVHGMGRSPLSGWPLLRRLRKAGLKTQTFAYCAAFERFDSIVERLISRIQPIAQNGPYILIGHSLGGVLLRAALQRSRTELASPKHMVLLGSPIQPSRLAVKLKDNKFFQLLTGDCGQLLGCAHRMAAIGAPHYTVTAIAGVKGLPAAFSSFGQEPNDGIVSLSEVSAPWLATPLQIYQHHTWLPSSKEVADTILLDH